MRKALWIICFLPILLAAQQKTEFRAVWITNVDSYVLFSDKNITDAVNYLAERGFNVIFPVVWNKGYTLYPSEVMQERFNVPIWQTFAGRDPLKKLIIEAHRVGIEVIPWFEFGFSSSYSLNGGHIISKYPSWAGRKNDGSLLVKNGFDWMAGTNPEVQDFMISIITEVLDNYDVDGVQGDDRLPAMPVEGGYDSTTVAIYKAENGGANPPTNFWDTSWKRWRANKLNSFFRRMKDSVKVRGEHLIISAAPSNYPWGYDEYLQDSKTWVDSGIVENFIPQLYRYDYTSYANELINASNLVPASKKHIFFPGMLTKAGSYVISPSFFIQSMNLNRTRGMKGECFFFYESFPANNNQLGDTLRALYYNEPALVPYRNGNVFRPAAEIINEDDELNTQKQGNWVRVPVAGFNPQIYWTNDTSAAWFDYYFEAKAAAWYDIYVYNVPNFAFTQFATYKIYDVNGEQTITFNQQTTANAAWVKIGEAYLNPGRTRVLRVDNTQMEAGKYLLADAAMMMVNRKKSPDAVFTSSKEELPDNPQIPGSFEVYDAYPNPFNPATNIRFSLPESGLLKAELYNALGQRISVLADDTFSAGEHSLRIDGLGLTSGIYFVNFQMKVFHKTVKVLLLK